MKYDLLKVKNSDMTVLDKLLVLHSAPTLLGIKTANLFACRKELAGDMESLIEEFNSKAAQKNIYVRILCQCNFRLLFLVYNKSLLLNDLKNKKCVNLLKHYGYAEYPSLEKNLIG